MGALRQGRGSQRAALSCAAMLGVLAESCASQTNDPPCLLSGTRTLALTVMSDAGSPCNPYDGATLVLNLASLHYAGTGSSGTANIEVTRSSPAMSSDQWTQCTLTDHPSCQQVEVTCFQGSEVISVYLSNNADGPGFAQYQVGQCYENYTIRKING